MTVSRQLAGATLIHTATAGRWTPLYADEIERRLRTANPPVDRSSVRCKVLWIAQCGAR